MLARRFGLVSPEEGVETDIGVGFPNTMLDAPGELFAA
jgi:hypothetical protein